MKNEKARFIPEGIAGKLNALKNFLPRGKRKAIKQTVSEEGRFESPLLEKKKPRISKKHFPVVAFDTYTQPLVNQGFKEDDAREEVKKDPEKIRRITTVEKVEELDRLKKEEFESYLSLYHRLLRKETNRHHFVGVSVDLKRFIEDLSKPEYHVLVGKNKLNEVIGYCVVHDAASGQNDHWIEKLVVLNRLQNKYKKDLEEEERKKPHTGTQFLDKILNWAFSTSAHDRRERININAAVVMFVSGYQRADQLLEHSGFIPFMRLRKQAEVQLPNGQLVVRDVQRFALSREEWEAQKHFRLKHHISTS